MKRFAGEWVIALAGILALVTSLTFPAALAAEDWHARVGAQSSDKGKQALAFLPDEMWIHAGDSITWNFAANEIHTVTFLTPGQVRPPFQAGCPGTTANDSMESGTGCVNSGALAAGDAYTVVFPVAGNFKLACLVHNNMTATIHVLSLAETLPHDQAFYDAQALQEQLHLMSDPLPTLRFPFVGPNDVTTGVGEIAGNSGGSQTVSLMRFMDPVKLVHVGQTVEWANSDPVTPHTITFGAEPANDVPPSGNVTMDADGARHAVINSATENVHSGLIMAGPQDRTGLPQSPLSVSRFRVTFTAAGVFPYRCALHDSLGMVGEVIVLP